MSVTDQKARAAVDRPALENILYHPRCGLAPVAVKAIVRNHGLRVKRAVTDVVEVRARHRELGGDLRMQSQQIVFRIEPSGDPGLIGNDEHKEARIIQRFDCHLGTVDPAETCACTNMSVIVVEHAVPVEKRGGPLPLTRDFLLCVGKRFGNSDVDEIPVAGRSQQLAAASKKRKYVPFQRTG